MKAGAYRKMMLGENIAKVYYRNGINGQEVLLFGFSAKALVASVATIFDIGGHF